MTIIFYKNIFFIVLLRFIIILVKLKGWTQYMAICLYQKFLVSFNILFKLTAKNEPKTIRAT